MKKFVKIEIKSSSAEEAEILIADLSDNDFYAFEQDENVMSAYIENKNFDEEKLKILLKDAPYKYSDIEEKNWNEVWEREVHPVIIENFVGIRASFHEAIQNVKHEIIITPKMSFGTGHHATTSLMVKQMAKIDFKDKIVVDFGTGTGILAILAEKVGAATVFAIDNDEWSINNALENIDANHCKSIQLEKQDNIKSLPFVNVILANINFNVLSANVIDFSRHSQPGSILVASGFLQKDEESIMRIFVKNRFQKIGSEHKDGWLVMVFERC